jgi:hypothetical protein
MADPFVRSDVWTLRANAPWDPITEAYARAVRTMQARPPNDPTSWSFQAAIHGSYVAPPPGARWNECQHASWFFLPWHRMYLFFFERIVRAAVLANGGPSDWALPYWNYDQPAPANTLPLPFRTPTLPDGTRNPLFLPAGRRNAAIANGAQLSPFITSSQSAMMQTRFDGPPGAGFGGVQRAPAHFGGTFGAIEQTPHNDVHVQVGGNRVGQCQGGIMIDPNCAALDPIFWLHHANIDRLWSRWIAQGGRSNPTLPAWRNQQFLFVDEAGQTVSMTPASVVDTAAQLAYVYDDDVPPSETVMVPEAEQPEPSRPPELVAASERPIELAGGPVSVSLTVPPSTRELVSAEALAPRESSGPPRSVFLNVEDIAAESNPGVVYGVFVNVPTGADEAERARHHVGNITVFGVESVNDPDKPHDTVPGFRHTFDITPVVTALRESGRWDPDTLNVTFEPLLPVAPEGAMELASPELANAAETPIQIGRVSLFVA